MPPKNKTHLLFNDDGPPPPDPDSALLRQVITLGMLIKILLGVGGLLMTVGVYEVNQLDKLRDQASTLQATVSGLQSKVENTQAKLDGIQKTGR